MEVGFRSAAQSLLSSEFTLRWMPCSSSTRARQLPSRSTPRSRARTTIGRLLWSWLASRRQVEWTVAEVDELPQWGDEPLAPEPVEVGAA